MGDLVLGLVATPTGLNSTDSGDLRSGGPLSSGSRSGRGKGSLGDVDAIVCLDAEAKGTILVI